MGDGNDEPPSSGSTWPQDLVEVVVDADVATASARSTPHAPVPRATSRGGCVTPSIDAVWIGDRLRAAILHLAEPVRRVSVRIVSDATISALHGRHCGDPTTTDVLTFPEPHDPDDLDGPHGASDGVRVDIVVCADEAGRVASERAHAVDRELLLYALHGLLHCCGYDDADQTSFAAMHAEEDRILERIGVGVTFADTTGADTAGAESARADAPPTRGDR